SIVLRGPKGATSYSWSPSGSTADSLIITGAGTYSLTINNYWGCSGTAVKTISISPNPVVTISSPSLLCTGNSATISASGATSYTWSNGVNSLYTVVNPTISTNYTVTGQNSSGCKSSAAVTLSVSTCTGIEELNTYDFRIYPNPANESITIRSTINEKFLLSIYTALGNKCLETNLNGSETNINISGLTAGIYFIRIQTSKGEINRKLIKE
ncbi:MAG TPA: T9SS type A sorting domain-containing protein, partial [Bacteroidia bacterium]|nr:T9SS type A sorting domain-containing protein [Bacteroidia bacterium]